MEIGEISPSMGINTKPAKDLDIGGYWLKVDEMDIMDEVDTIKMMSFEF
jgi:hypothetical protein